MGDNKNVNLPENVEEAKTSIEILRETQPSEDISVDMKRNEESINLLRQRSYHSVAKPEEKETERKKSDEVAKVETYFKKIDLDNKSDSTTKAAAFPSFESFDKHPKSQEKQEHDILLETLPRYNSDIVTGTTKGELLEKQSSTGPNTSNKIKHMSSNVFPVGCMGCKDDNVNASVSRRFINAGEANMDYVGHLNNTPKKRSASMKVRNPLTGIGYETKDENEMAQTTILKKKDGNPLLGTGYDEPPKRTETKVPPGGFSQGLW